MPGMPPCPIRLRCLFADVSGRRYNHLFYSAASGFSGIASGGAWASVEGLWPGAASYELRFANGTTVTVKTTATWPTASHGAMTYRDGASLFAAACLPGGSGGNVISSASVTHLGYTVPAGGVRAYPPPLMHDHAQAMRGYFLDNEVAVLQVSTFSFPLTGDAADFARTAVGFLARAAAAGKTKLIVDLSGNAGGDVVPGLNLFRILFPDRPIYSATRFRATDLVDLVGQVFSAAGAAATAEVPLDAPFSARAAVGPSQRHDFATWADLFGPEEVGGANMSRVLAHFDFDAAATLDDPLFGFGETPEVPVTQHFHAEDVVVVSATQTFPLPLFSIPC